MADIYFTVYGLTEKELSRLLCPEGILVMDLESFCYFSSQDCNNNKKGYIVFMRSKTVGEDGISNDQKNHTTYWNTILKTLVDGVQNKYSNRLWKTSMPIPIDTAWVSWQDGHGPALTALTTNQQQAVDRDYKLVTCKHSSSATATTQACDIGSQFRLIKILVKTTTEEILPDVGVKGLFIEQLNQEK